MGNFWGSKILNGQSRSVASAAFILALASLGSRLLGLLRDRLLAGQFGAGDTLDVYYAAFRLPDLVYNLLILGALSAGFVPVFVSLWRDGQDEKEAWQFVNSILNILLLGLVAAGLVFFIFTPAIMRLVTPGFSGEKLQLTIDLTRIMFLSPLLLGLSAVWGGVLQSTKRFLIFSLTPIFYNLGIIFGILYLVPRWGTFGLAWGVVLGALLHFIIQWPTMRSLGWRYRWVWGWANEGVRRLARLMVPRILTLALSQLNFLAITILASWLAAGSLAIFNLSYNIWTFPFGILASPLAVAVFPVLAQAASRQDREAFIKSFSTTCRQILFFIVPASVLLVVLRAQIVRVILGTGKFDWTDTVLTIDSLQYLTLGLFAEALMLLLVRGFFAWEDTKTPFWLGIIGSVCRVALAWWLAFSLGVAGLALGYALGGIVNMMLLWFFLERKVGGLDFGRVFVVGLKIVLAALAAGATAYGILRLMNVWVDTHTLLGLLSQGLVAGLSGILVYFLAAWLLRLEEVKTFWQELKNHLPDNFITPDKEVF